MTRITPWPGDITTLSTNAATRSLRGGGGVHGAIHRMLGDGPTDADHQALQSAHKARHPRDRPGVAGRRGSRDGLLADACFNSLRRARDHNLRSIAFPAISTSIYRFPAVATIRTKATRLGVRMVTHDATSLAALHAARAQG